MSSDKGRGSHKHSGNVTPTSPRISIFTFLVCLILLFLLTSGLLQSWRAPPWACSTGPSRHLEPLGRQPECPRVRNCVWVRAAALSSWPSYLGNSLWPNSSAKNQEPNENRSRITAKASVCSLPTTKVQQHRALLTLKGSVFTTGSSHAYCEATL